VSVHRGGRLRSNVYAPDRKAERPLAYLAGFAGVLQVDGYAGYRALAEKGGVELAFCWSHVRRRFYELAAAGPAPIASEALERIAALYAIEKDIHGRSAEERRAIRRENSRPIIDAFEPWLRGKHVVHHCVVGVLVRLHARRLNGRALAGVEHTDLDTRAVGIARHLAAQRIDLAHEVAFRRTADGRVARHQGHVPHVEGQKQGPAAHARGSQGGLAPAVACANHHDVIRLGEIWHIQVVSWGGSHRCIIAHLP